jgi:hypothetical protein
MRDCKQVHVDAGIAVFFCDPHSPWQRGSNENTNGLLRQYFPKGVDFSTVTEVELDAVAEELNQRPRKRFGFATPRAALRAAVAMTARIRPSPNGTGRVGSAAQCERPARGPSRAWAGRPASVRAGGRNTATTGIGQHAAGGDA